MKTDIDKLALTVIQELNAYGEEVSDIVKNAVEETAKETVKELKETSPVGKSGKYKKGWKASRDAMVDGRYRFDMIIHNKKYSITHLLEKGHAKRDGGRVEGIPHISKAEEHAVERLKNKIERGLL